MKIPILKQPDWAGINTLREKVVEELNELYVAYNEHRIYGYIPKKRVEEELMDLIQATISMVDYISADLDIDTEKAAEEHIQKMQGRGWEFKGMLGVGRKDVG